MAAAHRGAQTRGDAWKDDVMTITTTNAEAERILNVAWRWCKGSS
jgi:hypothetical protein